MFKLTIIILAVWLYAIQCAVIRPTEEETTTIVADSITTIEPEMTTVNDEDITTTTTERAGGLSRDEEASILILDQTLLDPSPAELIKTDMESVQVKQSAKLLLLSTPKIADKSKTLEENLEESEEQDESVQSSTETILETTTLITDTEETTTMLIEDQQKSESEDKPETKDEFKIEKNLKTKLDDILATTEKTTKLYPINDTLYEDNKMNTTEMVENSTLVVDEQPQQSLNSNFGSVVLTESEADYFLVDTEILEGSYTDADSELHLQPIVQSVEIVPSSLDDPLLINYVQSW